MSKKLLLQLSFISLIIVGFLTITGWSISNARIYNPGSGGNIAIGDGVTSGTNGSLLFVGSGTLTQNNANLFWDNTNIRLGIGSSTPAADLSVESAATTTAYIDSTAIGKGGCVELRTTGGQIIRVYATSTFVAGVGIPLYAELGACK